MRRLYLFLDSVLVRTQYAVYFDGTNNAHQSLAVIFPGNHRGHHNLPNLLRPDNLQRSPQLPNMVESGKGVVRQRKKPTETNQNKQDDKGMKKELRNENSFGLNPGSYWLTRIVLLRAIAFVYSKIFLATCRLLDRKSRSRDLDKTYKCWSRSRLQMLAILVLVLVKIRLSLPNFSNYWDKF